MKRNKKKDPVSRERTADLGPFIMFLMQFYEPFRKWLPQETALNG